MSSKYLKLKKRLKVVKKQAEMYLKQRRKGSSVVKIYINNEEGC